MLSGSGNTDSVSSATTSAPAPYGSTPATRSPAEAGASRRLTHCAGEVDTKRERHVGLELILPGRQQEVREAHADRVYVDQDLPLGRRGLGHVDDVNAQRAVEPNHLDSAHLLSGLDEPGELEVHGVGIVPVPAPGEAPLLEDRHDGPVDLTRCPAQVSWHVEVDRDA